MADSKPKMSDNDSDFEDTMLSVVSSTLTSSSLPESSDSDDDSNDFDYCQFIKAAAAANYEKWLKEEAKNDGEMTKTDQETENNEDHKEIDDVRDNGADVTDNNNDVETTGYIDVGDFGNHDDTDNEDSEEEEENDAEEVHVADMIHNVIPAIPCLIECTFKLIFPSRFVFLLLIMFIVLSVIPRNYWMYLLTNAYVIMTAIAIPVILATVSIVIRNGAIRHLFPAAT